MEKTVQIVVSGIVQGVFFRKATKAKALEKGITGEVKNKSDGSVQIVATGDEQKIDELIEWCRKGPASAVVTNVESTVIATKKFNKFTVLRD